MNPLLMSQKQLRRDAAHLSRSDAWNRYIMERELETDDLIAQLYAARRAMRVSIATSLFCLLALGYLVSGGAL